MIDADVVLDVFESACTCLSTLLNTSVGAWIGGSFIVLFIFKLFLEFKKI